MRRKLTVWKYTKTRVLEGVTRQNQIILRHFSRQINYTVMLSCFKNNRQRRIEDSRTCIITYRVDIFRLLPKSGGDFSTRNISLTINIKSSFLVTVIVVESMHWRNRFILPLHPPSLCYSINNYRTEA